MGTNVKGKLPKPNNIINIPVNSDSDFFKWWCIFLRPFIHLTNKEIEVVTSFLKIRWDLSSKISDPAILDVMVMSEDSRKKIMEECRISKQNFYVLMSNLKKHGIIVNNAINPRLIPNVRVDDNGFFQLLILFKDNRNEQGVKGNHKEGG